LTPANKSKPWLPASRLTSTTKGSPGGMHRVNLVAVVILEELEKAVASEGKLAEKVEDRVTELNQTKLN
jgi:hypothetical protein